MKEYDNESLSGGGIIIILKRKFIIPFHVVKLAKLDSIATLQFDCNFRITMKIPKRGWQEDLHYFPPPQNLLIPKLTHSSAPNSG